MLLPRAHIGEDHLIADLQTLNNFNGVYGTTAQLDGDANCGFAVFDEFEQPGLSLRLALDGTTDIKNVFEPFELNGAVHAEIGPHADRKGIVERDVHGHGAILDGRINADDMAFDYSIVGVNLCRLIG